MILKKWDKKSNRVIILGMTILAICTICLFVRSPYSFCQSDEPFYVALTHRLWLGDGLIVDDWHPTQFYSVLLLPFYALYRLLGWSQPGVLLYFRYVYLAFAVFTAFRSFLMLQKRYSWFSIFSSLLLLLYSRANICGPSYYNVSLLLCINIFLNQYRQKTSERITVTGNIGIGIMTSAAVLCNPYLIPPLVLFSFLRTKEKKSWLTILLTIVACAVAYVLFILSRAEISEVLSSLKYIMNDPQHVGSVREKYQDVCEQIRKYSRERCLMLTVLFSVFVLLFRRKLHPHVSVFGFLALFLLQIRKVSFYSSAVVDVCLFPFAVSLLPVFAATIREKSWSLEHWLYLEGWMIAVAFFFASNTLIDAMTVGFCICGYSGILLIRELLDPKETESSVSTFQPVWLRRAVELVICGLLLLEVIAPMAVQRFVGIYRDAPVEQLVSRIETGPAAGLYTTPEHAEQYYAVCTDITKFLENGDRSVLFSSKLPWAYLCTDAPCAAPVCWTLLLSDERLEPYFSKRESFPDIVVVLDSTVGGYEESPYNDHGGTSYPNRNDLSGWFWEQIKEKGTEVYSDEYMTIYQLTTA